MMGLQLYNKNGELVLSLTDRLFRIISHGVITPTTTSGTEIIYNSEITTDGSWGLFTSATGVGYIFSSGAVAVSWQSTGIIPPSFTYTLYRK